VRLAAEKEVSMSQKRPPRRLLACAALSAGVLLGSGAASADRPRPTSPRPALSSFAALLDAALRLTATAPATGARTDLVSLEPQCRMGNTKGPSYTDRAARASVERAKPVPAQPVQARTPARTSR
jgi:hypothetical protein